MDLDETTEDSVSLFFELIIKNPSQFYTSFPLPLYHVNLGLYFNETFIGYLIPQDLFIGKGDTLNVAIGQLVRTPLNEHAIGQFLSNYIMGFDVPILVNGTVKIDVGLEHNPDYPARIIVNWVMPGIETELISALYAPLELVLPPYPVNVSTIGIMNNPLEFDIEIIQIRFDGYAGDPCNRTISPVYEVYDFFFFPFFHYHFSY